MLSVPKLGIWTAVLLGMDSPPTESQQALLVEISHLVPTIPIPPPNSRSTSHSHMHSPLPFQHHPHKPNKHLKLKHTKRCIPSFRPPTSMALVQGLMGFNSHVVREGLREDAAEGFLSWCRVPPSSPSITDPEAELSGSGKQNESKMLKWRPRGRSSTARASAPAGSDHSPQAQSWGPSHPFSCGVNSGCYDPLNFTACLHLGLSICVGLLKTKIRPPTFWGTKKEGQVDRQDSRESDFTLGLGIGVGVGIGLGVAITLATEWATSSSG